VLLHRFGLRTGSGGTGKFHGGDGVRREIEFLEPMQVSILSEVCSLVLHVLGLRSETFYFILEKDKRAVRHGRRKSRYDGKEYVDQEIA
jgi:hypothetical protein